MREAQRGDSGEREDSSDRDADRRPPRELDETGALANAIDQRAGLFVPGIEGQHAAEVGERGGGLSRAEVRLAPPQACLDDPRPHLGSFFGRRLDEAGERRERLDDPGLFEHGLEAFAQFARRLDPLGRIALQATHHELRLRIADARPHEARVHHLRDGRAASLGGEQQLGDDAGRSDDEHGAEQWLDRVPSTLADPREGRENSAPTSVVSPLSSVARAHY